MKTAATVAALAWRYLWARPLQTVLNLLLLALGLAVVTLVLLVGTQIDRGFERDVQGIDLVVGAKGSPLQLILAGVFHIDVPPGNIALVDFQKLRSNPLVAQAIPLSLGDSFRGYRIVGTTPEYPAHYGATLAQGTLWQGPLQAVLGAGVDHVSAYSLIVEDGTAMARKVRRGELPAPDEDVLADRYTMIDRALQEHGFSWYEVSNWSKPGGECQHNLIYWRGGQWWGAGPGAHGCVSLKPQAFGHNPGGLTRTVNAKRPGTYFAGLIESDAHIDQPASITSTELLTDQDLRTERIMLGLRLAEGIVVDDSARAVAAVIDKYVLLGLLTREAGEDRPFNSGEGSWIKLTEQGRYLADGIVTDIIVAQE